MDKVNKYYINLKRAIILIVAFMVFGTVIAIIKNYNYVNPNVFDSIEALVILFRTFSMLGFLIITGYLVYKGYRYYVSKFYELRNIPIIDAFKNGFIDLAFVYDEVKKTSPVINIDINLTKKILVVKTKNKFYSVIVRDYGGKIKGKIDSDSWYVVSKKKKEFGHIVYKKKTQVENPYKENAKYIEELRQLEKIDYINLVCITSFRTLDIKSENVVQLFELTEIIKTRK